MKASTRNALVKDSWEPKEAVILMETKDEAITFRHLLGCYKRPYACNRFDQVKDMADRLSGIFSDLPLE